MGGVMGIQGGGWGSGREPRVYFSSVTACVHGLRVWPRQEAHQQETVPIPPAGAGDGGVALMSWCILP